MDNIDQRILRLESKQTHPTIPGTSIGRQQTETGFQWVLGLGAMCDPKQWYTGQTIEECLTKAEADFSLLDACI